MELITFFLAFLGSLAAHFLAHDAYTSAPRYARRLIKWAAQRLPNDHQKRYLEEWLADLDERPTVISKFQHAFECCICARKMSAICSGWAVVPEQLVTFDRSTALFVLFLVHLVRQKERPDQKLLRAARDVIEKKYGPIDTLGLRSFREETGRAMSSVMDDPEQAVDVSFRVKDTSETDLATDLASVFAELSVDCKDEQNLA